MSTKVPARCATSPTSGDRFLTAILPELTRRAEESGSAFPLELGITVDDRRWLLHIDPKHARVEPDKLSRRHLTLTPATFVRLVMGHSGIDRASAEEGFESSTGTAIDAARILFPVRPIWRSPLDSATAWGKRSGRFPRRDCSITSRGCRASRPSFREALGAQVRSCRACGCEAR